MSRKTSFVSGAVILAAAGLICKVIGVLIKIWAYNTIGEEGMVYYEAVFPFYSWLLIVSSSGVPTAISRMVSERAALEDWAGAEKIHRQSALLLAGVGLVTALCMFFGAEWFSVSFIGKDASYVLPFKTLAPALLFVSVMCAYRGYLQGMQHMMGTGLSQLTEQIVKCALGLFLAGRWIAYGPQYGAVGLLAGITVSELCALGVVVLFRVKNRRQYFPEGASLTPRNPSPVIPALLGIAVPITLGASIIPITSMLDVKMIFSRMSTYLTETQVNHAYVALSTNVRSLINLPASLTTALAMSLVPAISASLAKKDMPGVHKAAGLGIKLSMTIGMPCAVGLYVLGGPIIRMLFTSITDSSLAEATRIMHVAAWSVIFISLAQTMTGELQGIGKHHYPVWFLLVGGVAKIASNYYLLTVPSVNILGASYSNIICYALAGLLDTWFFLRCTGMKLSVKDFFLKPMVCSALMGFAVYWLYKALYSIRPGSIITLLSVFCGIVLYGVFAVVCKLFTEEELLLIPGGTKILWILRKLHR